MLFLNSCRVSVVPYYARKNAQVVTGLQTSCYKSVHKLSTSCVRTACSKLVDKQCENNFSNLLTTSLGRLATRCEIFTRVCGYSPSSYSKTALTLKGRLILNLHSLSVSELLEYRRVNAEEIP